MRGRVLDNTYLLLEEIGRGGFGAVYRGVRLGLEGNGNVAIKLLNSSKQTPLQEIVRFQREAIFLSQLVHPGIVAVHELGEEKDSNYIVMEFVGGPNLREFVKSRGGKLTLPEVISILLQAAEALEYVHAHEIVHRDIKPQNILICESFDAGERRTQAKLVDFGVARLFTNATSAPTNGKNEDNEIVGTYSYMAPEATGLVDWPIDGRADVYSLGMVGFELLAGRSAFFGLKKEEILRAHVSLDPPPIKDLLGYQVPSIVERIIRKCLSKKPDDRYQSMFGLVCDLKHLQQMIIDGQDIVDFPLTIKDIPIDKTFARVLVGRDDILSQIEQFREPKSQLTRLTWTLLKGGVGVGKTRLLQEVKHQVEKKQQRYISIRFNESQRRLPYQSLAFAINDYLTHFERVQGGRYLELVRTLSHNLCAVAPDVAKLIPAFRQHVGQFDRLTLDVVPKTAKTAEFEKDINTASKVALSELDVQSEEIDLEVGESEFSRKEARTCRAIIDLLAALVGKNEHLMFLLDDIHLADSETLRLLRYVSEHVNQNVNFDFVVSFRDRVTQSNIDFESFVKTVKKLKRRCQTFEIQPLNTAEVAQFLSVIGIEDNATALVHFVESKCLGIPLQIRGLIKQMIAFNALAVERLQDVSSLGVSWRLHIRWSELSKLNFDLQNIEVLLASLENMPANDLLLLRTISIANDACEFDYLVDPKQTDVTELEARVLSIARRGYLEIVGDQNAPLRRRAFLCSHQKLRNALLSQMTLETRREIHVKLASRISELYRTPRREQVLALAKHFDGAGPLSNVQAATKAFVRAVRVYVQGHEYSLARYYIDRALERVTEIPSHDERLKRLREIYEAEYTIYASQGNLIAASEVCKQLIEITHDPFRKQTLQVFLLQLLLGLGRYAAASREASQVLQHTVGKLRLQRFKSFVMSVYIRLMGSFLEKPARQIVRKVLCRKPLQLPPHVDQAIALLGFIQIHGSTGFPSLLFAINFYRRLQNGDLRWRGVEELTVSAMLLRENKVRQAYSRLELAEQFFERQGMSDARRWANVIKAVWFDYPLGRFERILALFDPASDAQSLPTSGVLHFESYALRSNLCLLSSSFSQKEAIAREQRRRSDDSPGEGDGKLAASQGARRILDAGENGPYTSCALFCDSMRFALTHKVESLRRTSEQLKRQVVVHELGEVFARMTYSLQALTSGRQKEALQHYTSAVQILGRTRCEMASVLITDSLRLGILFLPLLAISLNSNDWPWGKSYLGLLKGVGARLKQWEGERNPSNSALSLLYKAHELYLDGKPTNALAVLEEAIRSSRNQKTEFVECLAYCLLGVIHAFNRSSRARENYVLAMRMTNQQGWKLLERLVVGLARKTNVNVEDIVHHIARTNTNSAPASKVNSIRSNPLLRKLTHLNELPTADVLLAEGAKLAAETLGTNEAWVFIYEKERQKFVLQGHHSFQKALAGAQGAVLPLSKVEERDIVRWLSRTSEEPVKFVKLDDPSAQFPDKVENTATASFNTGGEDDGGTRVLDLGKLDSYIVLVAILFKESILGWIALPKSAARADEGVLQTEHNLAYLGLQLGHQYALFTGFANREKPREPNAPKNVRIMPRNFKTVDDIRRFVPQSLSFEVVGDFNRYAGPHWNVFNIRKRRLLIAQWNFVHRKPEQGDLLAELLSRQLEFYIQSLSVQSELISVDQMIRQIANDLSTLWETSTKREKPEAIDVHLLLIDVVDKTCAEGDFGAESLSFVGQATDKSETLFELAKVLATDRLVYRERVRQIEGLSAWFIATSNQGRGLLPRFARFDLLERYQRMKQKDDQKNVAYLLGVQDSSDCFGFAVFFDPDEAGQIAV